MSENIYLQQPEISIYVFEILMNAKAQQSYMYKVYKCLLDQLNILVI